MKTVLLTVLTLLGINTIVLPAFADSHYSPDHYRNTPTTVILGGDHYAPGITHPTKGLTDEVIDILEEEFVNIVDDLINGEAEVTYPVQYHILIENLHYHEGEYNAEDCIILESVIEQ